jgi:hypothetical protein
MCANHTPQFTGLGESEGFFVIIFANIFLPSPQQAALRGQKGRLIRIKKVREQAQIPCG